MLLVKGSSETRSPRYLWKGRLKRDSLDMYLTTFLGLLKFKNTSAMRVIFFRKAFKLNINFANAKKIKKNFFFEVIPSELSLITREYLSSEVNGSSFFWKSFLLNLNWENGKKNCGKDFFFWDNCISRCCNKLSLLRREYLSSAVNGLISSPKITHIAQREFFKRNWFDRDH